MIRDVLITAGFFLAAVIAARGAYVLCGDVAALCRTLVRARRP